MTIFVLSFVNELAVAQQLPAQIRSYLDGHYKGWELSPTTKGCDFHANKGYVFGDFDGDGRRDFAVKFMKGKKGYILAFLRRNNSFKAYILHDYESDDAKYSNIGVLKKGSVFEYENKKLRLQHDAPSDYWCESDVGGIHYYRNGRFVGY